VISMSDILSELSSTDRELDAMDDAVSEATQDKLVALAKPPDTPPRAHVVFKPKPLRPSTGSVLGSPASHEIEKADLTSPTSIESGWSDDNERGKEKGKDHSHEKEKDSAKDKNVKDKSSKDKNSQKDQSKNKSQDKNKEQEDGGTKEKPGKKKYEYEKYEKYEK